MYHQVVPLIDCSINSARATGHTSPVDRSINSAPRSSPLTVLSNSRQMTSAPVDLSASAVLRPSRSNKGRALDPNRARQAGAWRPGWPWASSRPVQLGPAWIVVSSHPPKCVAPIEVTNRLPWRWARAPG